MTIKEIQEEIVDEFEMFEDWTQRYEHIIELGKELPLLAEEEKDDKLLIKGCQSRVWLKASYEDELMKLEADSDAIITKGIVALVVRLFNNQKPEDIINCDMNFFDKIGLKDHLSPTRANGLVSMLNQIRLYAIAFQSQNN